jgi:hypothetical protein
MQPNQPAIATRDLGRVALFFRSGSPHRLAPSSICLVLNYDSGVNRTMRHRGFQERAEARRWHTPDEVEYLGHVYRYRLEFYPDWEALIAEEEHLLATCPQIGPAFLSHIKRLSKKRHYRPAKPLRDMKAPTDTERVSALVEELEARHQRPTLSKEEQQVALDTARAIGAIQLTLFGQQLPLSQPDGNHQQAA